MTVISIFSIDFAFWVSSCCLQGEAL